LKKHSLTNLEGFIDVAFVYEIKKTLDSHGRIFGLQHSLFVTLLPTVDVTFSKRSRC